MLPTHTLQSHPQHFVVVECQRGNLVDAEPPRPRRIVATLHAPERHNRIESDADGAPPWVAVHTREGVELLDMGGHIARLLAQFAQRAGFSQASVSLYIHGKRRPNIESLRSMAEVFDMPISYFISDEQVAQEELGHAVDVVVANVDRLSEQQLSDLTRVLDNCR